MRRAGRASVTTRPASSVTDTAAYAASANAKDAAAASSIDDAYTMVFRIADVADIIDRRGGVTVFSDFEIVDQAGGPEFGGSDNDQLFALGEIAC